MKETFYILVAGENWVGLNSQYASSIFCQAYERGGLVDRFSKNPESRVKFLIRSAHKNFLPGIAGGKAT